MERGKRMKRVDNAVSKMLVRGLLIPQSVGHTERCNGGTE